LALERDAYLCEGILNLCLTNFLDNVHGVQVEHIIREQNILAAYDILELFCELVAVRLPIIESQK
jgi:hypothetical protein